MKFVKSMKVGAALCGAFGLTAFGAVSPEGVADINADVAIDSGTVEFAGKGAAADAEYPSGLFASDARSFHLDATKNLVFDGDGTLVAWLDARETPCPDYDDYLSRCESQGFSYPRAIVYVDAKDSALSSVPPDVKADAAVLGDKSYVDFGEYGDGGSHMWLLFVDANGVRMSVSLRAMVGAVGFGASAGFLLGDVTDPSKCGTGSDGNCQIFFHKGSGGGTGTSDAIYTTRGNCPTPYFGETLLDGRRVADPSVTMHIRNGWEIFSQNGPAATDNKGSVPFVSTLFNAGNFKKKSGVNDRQGGGKVGEIIYFSRVLTEPERMQVEAYLNQKWFGRCTAGTVTVAAGATAAVSAATDTSVESFAGAGDVTKTGDGRLQIRSNASLLNGTLAIEKGRVEVMGGNLDFPPVRATAGQRMTATVNALEPSATAARADEFAVDGDAATKVTLTEVGADVMRLSVSAGTLSVKAPVSGERHFDFFSSGTNLIANGDFEADTFTDAYVHGYTPTGWDLVGGTSGLSHGGSAFCNGTQTTVYSGVNCYHVQTWKTTESGISQTVTVPCAGLYTLSLAMRSRYRSGYPANDQEVLCVYVDDKAVLTRTTDNVAVRNSTSGKFVVQLDEHCFQLETVDLWLEAGERTFKFLGRATADCPKNTEDRALLLDDIRLTPKRDALCAVVPDPGFDCVSEILPIDSEKGIYKASPTGSPWTFGADGEDASEYGSEAGITRFPSQMSYFAEDETTVAKDSRDHQQLYLHRHAWATVLVDFPASGNVILSFRASRGGFGRQTGSVLHIRVDDVDVVTVKPVNTYLTRYAYPITVAEGRHTLKIEAVPPDEKDYALAVDDVEFRYLGRESVALVKDFGGDAWEIVPDTVTAGVIATTGGNYFEAQLAGDAGVRQTVDIPEAGVYALSADMVGRFLFRSGAQDEYHSAANYPHRAGIYVDGVRAASFAIEDTEYRRMTFRLPYMTAGSHVLTIKGDDVQNGVRPMSRVRAPELFLLETAAAAPDLTDKEIVLKDGAKLNLDMPGTTRLGKLRVNGKTVGGTFSASNCDFITGSGEVVSEVRGGVILLR